MAMTKKGCRWHSRGRNSNDGRANACQNREQKGCEACHGRREEDGKGGRKDAAEDREGGALANGICSKAGIGS